MKTLVSIAIGVYTDTLITMATDITIKEHRKLILVPRKTQLSAIHLENILELASLNITIQPTMPAMYIKQNVLKIIFYF